MRKMFPIIIFVDKIPEDEVCFLGLNENEEATGLINYTDNQIYIKRQKKMWLVLLHELVHWLIFVVVISEDSRLHKWLDKYLTVQ